LPRLEADLAVRLAAVKADQAELKKTIAFTAEPEKSVIIAQAKAEDDRAIAGVNAAIQSGAKWVPLYPRSQVSVETLQKTAISEASRLVAIPVAAMNQSIAKVDEARTAISQNDFKTATTLLTDATSLWAQNEAAHYWSDRLKEETAAPVVKLAATPKPLPTVRPATQVAAGGAAASSSAPVAASDDKPYYETVTGMISIVAGVLVVGGIIASVVQKKTRKQPAE